jgi:hypothetical protein
MRANPNLQMGITAVSSAILEAHEDDNKHVFKM